MVRLQDQLKKAGSGHCCMRPTGSSGAAGKEWSHFNVVPKWPRRERASLYGSNDVAAGHPNLLKITWQQLCQPMFVVQVVASAYKCNDVLDWHAWSCSILHDSILPACLLLWYGHMGYAFQQDPMIILWC